MGLKGLRVGEVKRYVQEGLVDPIYASTTRQSSGLEERAALAAPGARD
jgi:hypothetical protein